MTSDQQVDVQPSEQRDTEAPDATSRTEIPKTGAFKDYIASGWADRAEHLPPVSPLAAAAAPRRAALSARYPGKRLVIEAGEPKVRSNDTDFPYRAHSAFSWLTGWGDETVAGSVLVFEPTDDGHDVALHFQPAAGRDTDEFYANAADRRVLGRPPALARRGRRRPRARRARHRGAAAHRRRPDDRGRGRSPATSPSCGSSRTTPSSARCAPRSPRPSRASTT